MNKKEQKIFVGEVLESLVENGVTIGFFLKKIEMSRTHWFFIKKGDRPLTADKKTAIESFLNERLMLHTD